jgi:DNA-binding SARP family transcriptional activator
MWCSNCQEDDMQIKALGPIEVAIDDRVVRLSGQRQRALLAALVLDHGKVVPVDRLVDILWDACPPATARVKVQAHVSALRQLIGHPRDGADGPLLTRPPGYLLSAKEVDLDLSEFHMLASRGRASMERGDAANASATFAMALAIWRGPAFADVESLRIRSAAVALEERRLLAVEAKAEADLALGRREGVVAELGPWIITHPLRERLRALLMLALYRLGCRADALRLYRDGRQVMVAELGLEPGQQLRSLHQRILAEDAALHRKRSGSESVRPAGTMFTRIDSVEVHDE